MDIAETKDSYKILIDMPGRKREDISIDLDGRKLIISSPQLVEDDNDCTYILSERNRSSIRNSLLLPFNVDPDKLDALFEDGVLKITIQKINVSQTKKIEIS
jgi:HSP20 family protein